MTVDTAAIIDMVDPVKALDLVFTKRGCPYIWGAKGPNAFDCSGLVTWAIYAMGGPDWRDTHHCQKLFELLEPLPSAPPVKGRICLVFYGRTIATHVMWVVGDGRVFGACGGDSKVTTPEEAKARDASVRFRSQIAYRRDLMGFRLLRLRPQPAQGAADARPKR